MSSKNLEKSSLSNKEKNKLNYSQIFNEWEGDNFFFCKGKIFTGSQSFKPLIFSATIITVPKVLFFSYNFNNLYNKNPVLTVISLIIILIIAIAEIVFMIISGCEDPGILKRNNVYSNIHEVNIKIVHKGVFKQTKLCQTCHIAKPFRSGHCGDCDNCTLRFDHHCPWIGSCVGRRNYIYFYFFLVFQNLNSFLLLLIAIFQIVKTIVNRDDKKLYKNEKDYLYDIIISIFVVVYTLAIMSFTTGLIFYHTKLVIRNMTTKEEIKKLVHSQIGNYNDKGISKNCSDFWNRRKTMPKLYTVKELRQEAKRKIEKISSNKLPEVKEERKKNEIIKEEKLGEEKNEESNEMYNNNNKFNTKMIPKFSHNSNNSNDVSKPSDSQNKNSITNVIKSKSFINIPELQIKISSENVKSSDDYDSHSEIVKRKENELMPGSQQEKTAEDRRATNLTDINVDFIIPEEDAFEKERETIKNDNSIKNSLNKNSIQFFIRGDTEVNDVSSNNSIFIPKETNQENEKDSQDM